MDLIRTDEFSLNYDKDLDTYDESDNEKPNDKCYLVYIIFFIIGIGALLPWNFFITLQSYFIYQLRTDRRTASTTTTSLNAFQQYFPLNLTICSLPPLAISNFVNILLGYFVSPFKRILTSGVIMVIIFIITLVFTRAEIGEKFFLIITLLSVIIINIAGAIFQGSMFGILSTLPDRNSRGFLEGQAMSGIMASVASLITLSTSSDQKNTGTAYFTIAVVFLILALILFLLLFKSKYFLYHWKKSKIVVIKSNDEYTNQLSICEQFIQIFKKIIATMFEVRWPGSSIFLTFTLSLIIFPSLLLKVKPLNTNSDLKWKETYFIPVCIFLFFNIFDYSGRWFVSFVKWPKSNQKLFLLLITILRFVMIPLFLFCSLNKSKNIPTLFRHDAVFMILVMILGFTNGYYATLSICYTPRYASPGNLEFCGMAISTYLALGLATGVCISYGLVAIV